MFLDFLPRKLSRIFCNCNLIYIAMEIKFFFGDYMITIKYHVFCVFICWLFLASSSQALQFSYDNYTKISQLQYSFSFDGYCWFQHVDSSVLSSREFRTLEFGKVLPLAWKVTVVDDKKMHCWRANDQQKKPVPNIVTLKQQKYTHEPDLLLDVIPSGSQGLLMHVIDLDGNKVYSNTIECYIE